MRKLIVLSAMLIAFVFTGNAVACSNLGFLNKIHTAANHADKAATFASGGDYVMGRVYINKAQRIMESAPIPCASTLRTVRTQYGYALDYEEAGIMHAIAGNYSSAISALKKGNAWLGRALSTLKAYNNR